MVGAGRFELPTPSPPDRKLLVTRMLRARPLTFIKMVASPATTKMLVESRDAMHPVCASFRDSGNWPETGPNRIPLAAPNPNDMGLFEPSSGQRCAQSPLIYLGILTGLPVRNAWVGGSNPSCGTKET